MKYNSMLKILEAVQAINSDAKVTIQGHNLDDFVIEFSEGTDEIPRQTIIDKYNELNGA
tara:strand:- start:160 stop:336 length:177 start_codon:yes stop_codon:yes gene_type:complete